MVTVQKNEILVDPTDKYDIEQAILHNNEEKYKQSFHTPFFCFPLSTLFGFKGLFKASQQVLNGTSDNTDLLDEATVHLLSELATPQSRSCYLLHGTQC
jgi:hypothetical protein